MPTLPYLTDAALLNVWEHLLGDLPAHVALAQTCSRLRAVYDTDDDRWRAACFVAGFGRPQRAIEGAGLADDLSWKTLACIIVKHAALCEIGSCIRANACFGERASPWPASLLSLPLSWTRPSRRVRGRTAEVLPQSG